MKVLHEIVEIRQALQPLRHTQQRIVLVPTMGNLHAGHLALIERAKQLGEIIVVSIFVNPLQFAPNEDYASYPRTLANDCEQLTKLGVDIVYAPTNEQLQIDSHQLQTQVTPKLGGDLCGVTRPIFFQGIATIVCKLFNIVQPELAVFGKKDYQQLTIIRQMMADLNYPIAIESIEIQRDENDLALSSRNQYLSAQQREQAAILHKTLLKISDDLLAGEKDFLALQQAAIQQFSEAGFKTDYVEIRRQQDLKIAQAEDKQLVILVAAWLGKARLIDNAEVTLASS